MPDIVLPQLATVATEPPEGEEWLHEIKYDGYRLLCRKDGSNVDIFTRRGNNWSQKFPAIREAMGKVKANRVWMDGELVVMTEEGRSCFGSLQEAVHQKNQGCLAYYVFDLLYLDGKDLCQVPLLARKHMLKGILPKAWNIKFIDYILGFGPEFFEAACGESLEGIISKKVGSFYYPGRRSRDWLKSKCRGYSEIRTGSWENWGAKR